MRSRMSAHQVRRARTNAPAIHTLLECLANTFVVRETKIIIAAKIQQLTAIDNQFPALCALDDPAPPVHRSPREPVEACRYFVKRRAHVLLRNAKLTPAIRIL